MIGAHHQFETVHLIGKTIVLILRREVIKVLTSKARVVYLLYQYTIPKV